MGPEPSRPGQTFFTVSECESNVKENLPSWICHSGAVMTAAQETLKTRLPISKTLRANHRNVLPGVPVR